MIKDFSEPPKEFWEDLKHILIKHFGKNPNAEGFECLLRSIAIYAVMCTQPKHYKKMQSLFIHRFAHEMTSAVEGAILLERFGKQ